jgi:2,5-furandicarboxylate decarboxylase 1
LINLWGRCQGNPRLINVPGGADLRSFIQRADEAGEPVIRIARKVSPIHELSAVVKAFERQGNPILVFENVEGAELPVIDGVFGSRRRLALALGVDVQSLTESYIERLANPLSPEFVAEAKVHEVINRDDVDLGELPICVHAPLDAGRYITSGVCLARDHESGAINTGIYRIMLKGKDRVTLSVDSGDDLARILTTARERGEPVDVAIVVGGHPAIAIASQAKIPIDLDSLSITGALLGAPLRVHDAVTVDLPVPADADVVIEGRVQTGGPGEPEGPFGEFSYYYGSSMGWVCDVTAVTRRSDAIWLDIHPTHREHRILAFAPAHEARLLQTLRRSRAAVRAVHIPTETAGLVACISLRKRHDGEPRQVAMSAFGVDSLIKHVVIVDDDVDVTDPGEVAWALTVRVQADRDILMIPNAMGIAEDPSSYSYGSRVERRGLVTKTAIDATMPLEADIPPRADELPDRYAGLDPRDYLSPGPED